MSSAFFSHRRVGFSCERENIKGISAANVCVQESMVSSSSMHCWSNKGYPALYFVPWEKLDWYILNTWVYISLWVSLLHIVKYLLFLIIKRKQLYWKLSPVGKCPLAHFPLWLSMEVVHREIRNVWCTPVKFCSNYLLAPGFNFANLSTKAITSMALLFPVKQLLAVFPGGNRSVPYSQGRGTGTRHPAQ